MKKDEDYFRKAYNFDKASILQVVTKSRLVITQVSQQRSVVSSCSVAFLV